MAALDDIMVDMQDLVGDQLQVVTYKWLARHHGVPYDTAKRVLFEFFTKHSEKVKAMFLLSGWTKGEQQHVVRVVDGSKLEAAKGMLDTITAMHVYSVQPGVPKDSADLYNADYDQSEALFRSLLAGPQSDNHLLASNSLSTVRCPAAKRDPSLAARRPQPKAAAEPEGAKATAAKPTAGAGSSAAAGTAPSAQQKSAPTLAAAQREAAPAVKGAKEQGAAGKAKTSPAGKKGGSLQHMWSKAPAKEKKAEPADTAPSAAAAADGKQGPSAARPAAKKAAAAPAPAAAAAEPDDEAPAAQQGWAGSKVRPRAQVLEDSDSDSGWEDGGYVGGEEQEGAPAAKPQPPKSAKASLMHDSDFEDDFQPASGQHSQQPSGARQSSKREASAEPMEVEQGQAGKKKGKAPAKQAGAVAGQKKRKKGDTAAAASDLEGATAGSAQEEEQAQPSHAEKPGPKFGTVKVREPEPGAKRHKRVMRTYYNDAGEEVTEMVSEEEREDEGLAPAQHPQPPAQQQQQQPQQPAKAPAAAAKAGGAAKASGGGKKKAAPAGQKSIAAFFSKK